MALLGLCLKAVARAGGACDGELCLSQPGCVKRSLITDPWNAIYMFVLDMHAAASFGQSSTAHQSLADMPKADVSLTVSAVRALPRDQPDMFKVLFSGSIWTRMRLVKLDIETMITAIYANRQMQIYSTSVGSARSLANTGRRTLLGQML